MTELKLRTQVRLDANILSDILWQGSRITMMLNKAQNWLQQELLKTGSLNWKAEGTITFSAELLQGVACSKGDVPSNWLRDMPIQQIFPTTFTDIPDIGMKPSREVDISNLTDLVSNTFTIPTEERSIYVMMDTEIFIFPATITVADAIYTRKILDLVFDNDSVDSEIPTGSQALLVERVVSQINLIKGGIELTPLIIAEIDKRIAKKYQLEGAKEENVDRKVTQ